MAYRDEVEALHAKIERLESENAELRREIDGLRGDLEGGPPEAFERAIGGRLVVRAERVVEGELPETARARIVEVLRGVFGTQGRPVHLGRSLVFRGGGNRDCRPAIQVTVTSRDGSTIIRISERRGANAASVLGGAVSIFAVGATVITNLAVRAGWRMALFALPVWLTSVALVSRATFGSLSRGRARELDSVAATIAELATEEIRVAGRPAPKVRVDGAIAPERGARVRAEGAEGAGDDADGAEDGADAGGAEGGTAAARRR